jgi:hypothetical protein
MPGARILVRLLVGAALLLALVACVAFPVPDDPPAVALQQAGIYRLEVALAIFYGCLLLATPAYSGLAKGRLPIEISTRGAKFAAEADQTADRGEEILSELKLNVGQVVDGLTEAMVEIERLKRDVTEND